MADDTPTIPDDSPSPDGPNAPTNAPTNGQAAVDAATGAVLDAAVGPVAERIADLHIERELQDAYLTYAMSTIMDRALPDVRDGLKPSQRRILVAMNDLRLTPGSKHLKCAKIAGNTSGDYHPHGEAIVYPTLVRLAQDWVMRHTLIDGQGNFGSSDGDPPAAMRYCVTGQTRVRLADGSTPRIDRLVPNLKPDAEADVTFRLLNRDGREVTASKVFHSGDHPTYRLRTAEGFEIVGTSNHPVLCLRSVEGVPTARWRLLGQIEPGERVTVFRKPAATDTPDRDSSAQTSARAGADAHVEYAAESAAESAAFLAGAFVAEGFCSETRCGFNNVDPEYFDAVVRAYDRVVGGRRYVYRRQTRTGSTLHELDVHNLTAFRDSPLAELVGQRSGAKRVPEFVWLGGTAVKRAFLRALYEGDGSCSLLTRNTLSVTYSTRSRLLACDLQRLLLEFGVVARQAVYANGETKVFMSDRRDARLFAERVGFWGRKHQKLIRLLTKVPRTSRAMSADHVPFLGDFLRRTAPRGHRESLSKHNLDRVERWEGAGGAAMLARITSPAARSVVIPLLEANHYYATVTAVEPAGVQAVYSVKVDADCHSFITDGIVSHNTEARLKHPAAEMLADLNLDTVDFQPNYDERVEEPTVLPGKFPNLLVNGSTGIAVGMACNLLPHNLGEICDAIVRVIDEPAVSLAELVDIVPGPDFPTGGIMMGRMGALEGYATGRGRVTLRAKIRVEQEGKKGRTSLVIDQVPYGVVRHKIVEAVADAHRNGQIPDVSAVNDESGRKAAVRIVIDLKREADPEVVKNQLFQHTPCQATVSMNNIAIVGRRPRTLGLRELIDAYVGHRREVVTRRTRFQLNKARQRGHLLEGLIFAVCDIDEVIALIRGSTTRDEAIEKLRRRGFRVPPDHPYAPKIPQSLRDRAAAGDSAAGVRLSQAQAEAIGRLQLIQLTGLEIEKLVSDYAEVAAEIDGYELLLSDERRILDVIREDCLELKEKYADPRRTEIRDEQAGVFSLEHLISPEEVVVTVSHGGYVKRLPTDTYRSQVRGGRGIKGIEAKEGDFVSHLFVANTHDHLLFFTNKGRAYVRRVFDVPEMGRTSAGKSVAQLLEFQPGEKIARVLAVKDFGKDESYLLFATSRGVVKKTVLSAYGNINRRGIIAMNLADGDELMGVEISRGGDQVLLGTRKGMAIRFAEDDVRPMGRSAGGVRGVSLSKSDAVVALIVVPAGEETVAAALADGTDPSGELVASDTETAVLTSEPKTDGMQEGLDGDESPAEDAEVLVDANVPMVLTACVQGFGKRTPVSQYRLIRRGGKGVLNIKTGTRNGDVVGMAVVRQDDEIMLITEKGILIRTRVGEVRAVGRNSQGVRLIRLDDRDRLVALAHLATDAADAERPAGE